MKIWLTNLTIKHEIQLISQHFMAYLFLAVNNPEARRPISQTSGSFMKKISETKN
jgi:hypothetical protein